jgi:hypothetical protein
MVQHIGELINADQQSRKSSADVWQNIASLVDGMDKKIFMQLIGDLWEGMGRKDPPGNTLLKMWYITLRKMTPDQLGRAIVRYLEEKSDEYCTPKLLLELGGVTSAGDTAAIEAWDDVVKEISRVGAYQTPRFRDVRTAAVIQNLGGWIRVCDTKPDELHKWTRQTFLKTFAAMPVTATARLTNLIETENARTGQTASAEHVQRLIAADVQKRIE